MFKRRIGPDPHRDGRFTSEAEGCPDVWELADGNFAVIGRDLTSTLRTQLPPSASCGADEGIVVIPRDLLVNIRNSIPKR
jgi:hypothetical protein